MLYYAGTHKNPTAGDGRLVFPLVDSFSGTEICSFSLFSEKVISSTVSLDFVITFGLVFQTALSLINKE